VIKPVDEVDPVDRADQVDRGSAAAPPPPAAHTPDPDVIERLRRSGIRIDREGEFQHQGEPVVHEGLRRALYRWLDRLPDGRTILRLDAERFVYVDVDDTPLVARAARIEGVPPHGVALALSDGSEERLHPETLTIDASGVMRCLVRNRRLPARLATSAATIVADLVEDRPGGPVLMMGGRAFPLGHPPAIRP
jgi:uncharacterized protein